TAKQREEVFYRLLANTGLQLQDIARLVALTEARSLLGFGSMVHRYTYSDLSQRIIPRAVESAVYTQRPLALEHLVDACRKIMPTPEMQRARREEPPPQAQRHEDDLPTNVPP